MKSYPSIPYWKAGHLGERVYVFEKLDGIQIRAKWTRKKGWDGFGSKGQALNYTNGLASVQDTFLDLHGEELPKLFKSEFPRARQITVFAEYWSPNSFVGIIPREDKEDYVTIFDVVVEDDFLLPRDFSKIFSGDSYRYAHCFGRFTYSKALVDLIFDYRGANEAVLPDYSEPNYTSWYIPKQSLFEGVVCKGTQRIRGENRIWQAKLKTNKWLTAVRALKGQKYLLEEVNGDEEIVKEIQ